MPKKKNYKKIAFLWLEVFVVGGLGGVLFMRVLVPWLAGFPPLSHVGWFCSVKEGTTIVNKTERVYVSQDTAYQEAIGRVNNAVVAVRAERAGRKPVESSGFILTSDGLVATANLAVIQGAKVLVIREGKEYEAEVSRQDKENNLTLLKINEANLPVINFGEVSNLGLGEMVFLAGAAKINDNFTRFVNLGFVKILTPEPSFTFTETPLADGAALGNIKGEVLGICLINKDGSVKLVGADKIRKLMK